MVEHAYTDGKRTMVESNTNIQFDHEALGIYATIYQEPTEHKAKTPVWLTTTTTFTIPLCSHNAGYYRTIPYGWWRKKIFVCRDCNEILDAKTMKIL